MGRWRGPGQLEESGLGLSFLATPLFVLLPGAADCHQNIYSSGSRKGPAVLPQEEAKTQQGVGERLPGVCEARRSSCLCLEAT